MTKYTHDSVVPFKDSGLRKKQQVAEMFNRIAFRYDFLNRFLSAGIDMHWRKMAIRELNQLRPKNILDVATGTADVAIMMAKQLHPEHITGIDISEGMLAIGQQKIARLNLTRIIQLLPGDSEDIQFPESSFDAITVAFGVRNFENLEKGLKEMWRILHPGGRLVVLEFSKPKRGFFQTLCNLYMKFVTPRLGKLVSKNAEAYRYLGDSVTAFPEGNAFLEILATAGFEKRFMKPLSRGICTIYVGDK
jgi:demethylmenaquinone methyltransferase/2-methoxy-6-polyprenyl-1,4-benzoquinol methylase